MNIMLKWLNYSCLETLLFVNHSHGPLHSRTKNFIVMIEQNNSHAWLISYQSIFEHAMWIQLCKQSWQVCCGFLPNVLDAFQSVSLKKSHWAIVASCILFVQIVANLILLWLRFILLKVGHNGPEEATYAKQGFGQHIEVMTVNGWRVTRGVRDFSQVNSETDTGGWPNHCINCFRGY